jgi:hypothetical protein
MKSQLELAKFLLEWNNHIDTIIEYSCSKAEVQRSRNFGKKAKNFIADKYPNTKCVEIAQLFGIRTLYKNSSAIKTVRAEINLTMGIVSIYLNPVYELIDILNTLNIYLFSKEDIVQMSLAHELFHFLEHSELICSKPKKYLSEISAHSFTQELLDLPYNPIIFDIIQWGEQQFKLVNIKKSRIRITN